MIAAAALILLADAVSPCTRDGTPRLGGRALLIRESGPLDLPAFAPLGPVASVVEHPTEIQQTAVPAEPPASDDGAAAEVCAPGPIPII